MDKVLCAELKKVTDELLVAANFMAAVEHGLNAELDIDDGAQYALEEVARAACVKVVEVVEKLRELGKEEKEPCEASPRGAEVSP